MSSLVGFDFNEVSVVVWFIIRGIISSDFLLRFFLIATEGKL